MMKTVYPLLYQCECGSIMRTFSSLQISCLLPKNTVFGEGWMK